MTMDRVNPDVWEYTLERGYNTRGRKRMATPEIFSVNNIIFDIWLLQPFGF